MMHGSALIAIQEIRDSMRAWLEAYGNSPDPTAQRLNGLEGLSQSVKRAERVIQEMSRQIGNNEAWKNALAEYRETLREVRERLVDFEIRLRIRREHMARANNQLGAMRSWSDLAKFVG